MSDASATHYGLDRQLETVERGTVTLPAALDILRAVYGGHRASYDSAEEALAETMFGFSRGDHDFIELCVNGRDDVSVTVELPLRTGWGPFKSGFRDERTVHSLSEAETLVQQYFTLSHEELREVLHTA